MADYKRLMVLTDPHFEGAEDKKAYWRLIETVALFHRADCIAICGDFVGGNGTLDFLRELDSISNIPYYFVLGNHDYWDSSIKETEELAKNCPEIAKHYLNYSGPIQLNQNTSLCGVSGFYDGGYGEWFFNTFQINDLKKISELIAVKSQREYLLQVIQEHTRNQIALLKEQWGKVTSQFKNDHKIITLSHVPPFPHLCYYNNQRQDNQALPYFCSKFLGEAFLDLQEILNPSYSLLGLFGHTHNQAQLILDHDQNKPILHFETLPSFLESQTKNIAVEFLPAMKYIKLIDL